MMPLNSNVGCSRRPMERGATAVDYAGIVLLVASLVLALIMVTPGVGDAFVCKLSSAISKISGQNDWKCDSDQSKKSDKHKPKEACTLNQRSRSASGSVAVGAGVEVNGSLVIETMSDGTYKITDTRGAKVGVLEESAGEGGGVKVTVDGHDYGAYAAASASMTVGGETGKVYVAKSEEEKNRYVEYLTRNAVSDVGGVPAKAANGAYNLWDQYVAGNEPPKPTEYYIELGAEGTGSASAAEAAGGAQTSGSVSSAVGMKVNTEENTVTTYYKVKFDGSGEAGALNSGLEVEAGAEGMVAVTVDADNPEKVLNLSATGSAAVNGGGKLPPTMHDQEEKGRVKLGREWTASVDLNSAETKKIAGDFMESVGISAPSDGRSRGEHVSDATNTFLKAAEERGVMTTQDLERDTSTYGVEASGKEIIGGGFGLKYSDQEIKKSNGYYYNNETGKWEKWEGC